MPKLIEISNFEANSELIDILLSKISIQEQMKHFYADQQEPSFNEQENTEHVRSSCSIGQSHRQPDISYEKLSNLSLLWNAQQRNEFHDQARKKNKTRNMTKKLIEPLRLFNAEAEDVGKSHLMKTKCMSKTMNVHSGSSDKPKTYFHVYSWY